MPWGVFLACGRLSSGRRGPAPSNSHRRPAPGSQKLRPFATRQDGADSLVPTHKAVHGPLLLDEWKAAFLKISANTRALAGPISEEGFADYREIAPGCGLPTRQMGIIRGIRDDGIYVIDPKRSSRPAKCGSIGRSLRSLRRRDEKWSRSPRSNLQIPAPLSSQDKNRLTSGEWQSLPDRATEGNSGLGPESESDLAQPVRVHGIPAIERAGRRGARLNLTSPLSSRTPRRTRKSLIR